MDQVLVGESPALKVTPTASGWNKGAIPNYLPPRGACCCGRLVKRVLDVRLDGDGSMTVCAGCREVIVWKGGKWGKADGDYWRRMSLAKREIFRRQAWKR